MTPPAIRLADGTLCHDWTDAVLVDEGLQSNSYGAWRYSVYVVTAEGRRRLAYRFLSDAAAQYLRNALQMRAAVARR